MGYLEGETSPPPRPPGFQFFLPIGTGGSLLQPSSILTAQRRDRRDSPEPADEHLACRWLRVSEPDPLRLVCCLRVLRHVCHILHIGIKA